MSFTAKLRTYAKLGSSSIARVALYRLAVRSGWHPVQRLRADVAKGPFLRVSQRRGAIPSANNAWDDAIWRFGWHRSPLSETPLDWFSNPFSEASQPDASRDWWQIPDFGTGDIKGLWELSRFDWLVAWATKAAGGDKAALHRMNDWLEDWARRNPPYKGPNWKCGQEASIRVMHLVTAAWILDQDKAPESGLVDLLITHLQRIAPTLSYAIGQQNNHGTSEAAALFIGGSFLAEHDWRAKEWARAGRYWLEERAKALIEPDGSFSQYSVTYHRLMLDSYALAEAWRRRRDLPSFSPSLTDQLAAATRWLDVMIDRQSGDAPNIGANDGAHLLQFCNCDYRDFRPSLQLAAALFEARDVFGDGPWTAPLRWLLVPDGLPAPQPASTTFGDGGYHVLRSGLAMAVMRFPRFRYRPSQADALHVDLWHAGLNLLRDAGSFSYNAEGSEWFSGTAAHNTIEFDGRNQMPRLSRFLFGDWLESDAVRMVQIDDSGVSAAAAYTDRQGARHHREIALTPTGMTCRDSISGTFRQACLRWRLAPGEWELRGNTVLGDGIALSIEVDGADAVLSLGTTEESRYYQQRIAIPVLSVTVDRATTLTTRMTY